MSQPNKIDSQRLSDLLAAIRREARKGIAKSGRVLAEDAGLSVTARGPTPSQFAAKGTANQAGLRGGVGVIEAAMGLTGTSRAAADMLILHFCEYQERALFSIRGKSEVSPPSHRQYWDAIFLTFYLAAILLEEPALIERTLKIVRAELALCHLCSYKLPPDDPGPAEWGVASPGVRGATPTSPKLWRNPATDVLYDLCYLGKVRKPESQFWADRYNLAPAIARFLKEHFREYWAALVAIGNHSGGKLLQGVAGPGPWSTADLLPLEETLIVRRGKRGHVAYFPELHGLDVQWATWCLDGETGCISWTPERAPKWEGGPIPEPPPMLDGPDVREYVIGPGGLR